MISFCSTESHECRGSVRGSLNTFSLYIALQKFDATQTVTHTVCGAGGDNGAERAGTDTSPEQTGWKNPESTGKGVPTAAHNPEVVGSNPAAATKKSWNLNGSRAFFLVSPGFGWEQQIVRVWLAGVRQGEDVTHQQFA